MTLSSLIRNLQVGESIAAPCLCMTYYNAASVAYIVAKQMGYKVTVRKIRRAKDWADWFVLRLA